MVFRDGSGSMKQESCSSKTSLSPVFGNISATAAIHETKLNRERTIHIGGPAVDYIGVDILY